MITTIIITTTTIIIIIIIIHQGVSGAGCVTREGGACGREGKLGVCVLLEPHPRAVAVPAAAVDRQGEPGLLLLPAACSTAPAAASPGQIAADAVSCMSVLQLFSGGSCLVVLP
jgi:hypothetical protein